MHGGTCRDFGSGLNCTCPEDYTGIGCQYEFDACEAGTCKNGASCIDKGQGYACICQPGFVTFFNFCLFSKNNQINKKKYF